jgi:hypothetical protein
LTVRVANLISEAIPRPAFWVGWVLAHALAQGVGWVVVLTLPDEGGGEFFPSPWFLLWGPAMAVSFGVFQWLAFRWYGLKVPLLWPILTVVGVLMGSLTALAATFALLPVIGGHPGLELLMLVGGCVGAVVGRTQQESLVGCLGSGAKFWAAWSAMGWATAVLGLVGAFALSVTLGPSVAATPLRFTPLLLLLLPGMLYAAVTGIWLAHLLPARE